jgi:hypothetical protein
MWRSAGVVHIGVGRAGGAAHTHSMCTLYYIHSLEAVNILGLAVE